MFLCAQKSQRAQNIKHFFLDVLCAQKCCLFYLPYIFCFLCFFPLRRFLCAFKTVFVFICSCAFCACTRTVFFICLCAFNVFLCQISNFLPLRLFLCVFKTVFLFICLCAFYACRIFSLKV